MTPSLSDSDRARFLAKVERRDADVCWPCASISLGFDIGQQVIGGIVQAGRFGGCVGHEDSIVIARSGRIVSVRTLRNVGGRRGMTGGFARG